MSVGNLPPGAEVLIKITYVAELVVEGEQIVFSLPGSVAPWKQEAALDETTQTDVEKIKVKDQRSEAHLISCACGLTSVCVNTSCSSRHAAVTCHCKCLWRCHLKSKASSLLLTRLK